MVLIGKAQVAANVPHRSPEKAVFFYRGLKGFESIAPLRFALSLNKGESTGECVHASKKISGEARVYGQTGVSVITC
jgi:hypothetical protein